MYMIEWKNILRGMAMGASDVIPGVSGGTLALILGIYYRLLSAISLLFSRQWKQQLGFLIPLGVGMGTAVLSLAHLLEWLLAEHPQPTFFFFFGLILGTIPFILYKVNYKTNFKKHHYVILLIAAVIVLLSGLFQGDEEAAVIATGSAGSFATLFFSGWLASTAMILPGISGSFVLVIIGVYQTVINALTEFNLPVLFTFGIGVLVGIAIMSKLLRYLLRAHTVGTYAVITGLLLGSLYVIFPGLNDGVIAFIISLVMFAAGLMLALFLGRIDRTRAV